MNTAHLGHLLEYLRPWKLVTLAVGIALLILGSFYYGAPDWDIPISFIMAIFAYLTAPWSMRVLLERKWRLWPVMLFFTWFTVDGCYAIYWHFGRWDGIKFRLTHFHKICNSNQQSSIIFMKFPYSDHQSTIVNRQ